MKENKYDDPQFFQAYGKIQRSLEGLEGAGEWPVLRSMFPDVLGMHVLDLGCGYGWHCRYIIEKGANSVVGVDISEKMLEKAKEINGIKEVEYMQSALEDLQFSAHSFDFIFSSLTLHYLMDYEGFMASVYDWLKPGCRFVFSVEHPIFTAEGSQEWFKDEAGNLLHWPVDQYFKEGQRHPKFLDIELVKYHRTLSTYVQTLLKLGFELLEIQEPTPSKEKLAKDPAWRVELRRPMMLLISVKKN
ncbi:class I SAM-dependent methyltransferase [Sphingobacterium kyonggiense]|uniref:Class I SAM-dependent methyltransferase n=1 Tax=Sphingobacterium kyonggiense TaxID=714075 RepID=A0ABP7Y5R6_9SPHI